MHQVPKIKIFEKKVQIVKILRAEQQTAVNLLNVLQYP